MAFIEELINNPTYIVITITALIKKISSDDKVRRVLFRRFLLSIFFCFYFLIERRWQ